MACPDISSPIPVKMYKKEIKKQGEIFFKEKLKKYFPNNDILYIV